jgi:hypothetical protein
MHPSTPLTGHTFGPIKGRYVLSIAGEIRVDHENMTVDNVTKIVTHLWSEIYRNEFGNFAPGVWYDDTADLFVFDLSTATDSIDDAIKAGKIQGQTAIWDSVDHVAIYL